MRILAGLVLLCICCNVAEKAEAQDAVDLRTVLERAQDYVAAYEQQLGTIIGQEEYDQKAVWDGTRPGGLRVGSQQRRMASDFLLTHIAGEWYGVRNVLTVDRKMVQVKPPDLAKVLAQSPEGVAAQLSEISKNNRRYNLGDFQRTFNLPTYPLRILHRSNFNRFTFEKAAETKIGGVSTWEIRFTEILHPAMIEDLLHNDQLQYGRLWIDPDGGRVLKTETLIDAKTGSRSGKVTFVVTYKENPKLNMLVLNDMREKYDSEFHRVECVATYSNFRRFETEVKLDIGPIEQ